MVRIGGSPYRSGYEPPKNLGWKPTCKCREANTVPATVLDPFVGSGTVGVVCAKHRRNFVGLDLKQEYLEMARKRTRNVEGRLF